MEDDFSELDALIDRVAARHMDRLAMPRGRVVLDENVKAWEDALKEIGFRVFVVPNGMPDEEIQKKLLGRQIFITANTKDFVYEATSYDFSIVSVDKIQKMSPADAAKLLSRAFIDFKLWSERPSWVIVIDPLGKHRFERLTD